MPFGYPSIPHARKHGPVGYEDYTSYKDWLRDEFVFRCVYCLEREQWYPNGADAFGVDHAKPKGKKEFKHLECDYDNLLYACNRCNSAKGNDLTINPCDVAFGRNLRVGFDGVVAGLTSEGMDLIDLLDLNDRERVATRSNYLRVFALFQKAPTDPEIAALFNHAFGYPSNLPDLDSKKNKDNSRKNGLASSHRRQHEAGLLSQVYGV